MRRENDQKSLYHYTECGLDYIYLEGGFTEHTTPRGLQISIENIDGLHRAIGQMLATTKKDLSGSELRFLRQEMLMSQATLASLLQVSEQAIHRWEKGKTGNVPKPAESLVRMLYLQHIKDENADSLRKRLKRIADLEEAIDAKRTARRNGIGDWEIPLPQAAA